MNNDPETFPDHYNFSQRYGYEPLPAPMQLGELSPDFRREICNAFESFARGFDLGGYFSDNGERLFRAILGEFDGIPDFEVDTTDRSTVIGRVQGLLRNEPCHHVLKFLEILLRQTCEKGHTSQSSQFANNVLRLLQKHTAAYHLSIEKRARGCPRYWFFPCDSAEHATAVSQALETLQKGGFEGATAHLRKAAQAINGGRHDDAITASIHAVESVARMIDSEASKTLAPALKSLQREGLITHDALRQGFEKLYGYTCDERGLRHALDKGEAAVGTAESVFMFGACAAFAGYLVRKQQSLQ